MAGNGERKNCLLHGCGGLQFAEECEIGGERGKKTFQQVPDLARDRSALTIWTPVELEDRDSCLFQRGTKLSKREPHLRSAWQSLPPPVSAFQATVVRSKKNESSFGDSGSFAEELER